MFLKVQIESCASGSTIKTQSTSVQNLNHSNQLFTAIKILNTAETSLILQTTVPTGEARNASHTAR